MKSSSKNGIDGELLLAAVARLLSARANGQTPDRMEPESLSAGRVQQKPRKAPAVAPVNIGLVLDDLLAKRAEAISEAELRRMYDIVQADARLSSKLSGLGFGRNGDAYRKAALKLRIMSLLGVLKDGKNIRNDIVHKPGYIPSADSASRALAEYQKAESDVDQIAKR